MVAGDHIPLTISTVVGQIASGMQTEAERPALVLDGVILSHQELDRFSNQVAHFLMSKGLRPGGRVGLCLDRSIEMIAALIGILKCGAAYVPLDAAYPQDRLSMMSCDAGLDLLIAHERHSSLFRELQHTVLVWEAQAEAVKEGSAEAPDVVVAPEQAAYIIFTSGSTGRPKGIEMPHRALANLIAWQLDRRSFRPGARVLQYSSISFDVSFQEIATTLASGGTLYLISNENRADPVLLLNRLIEQGIERLFLPYVAMRSLVEVALGQNRYPAQLREIITAGEALRVDDGLRTFFTRLGGASLDNQYGPSETHVITGHLLEGEPKDWDDLPPIGSPIQNNRVSFLDEELRPVGRGEVGELCLSGMNLALGYLGREAGATGGFIPNPADEPGYPMLYRTGDLGILEESGVIRFLGRKDHQVKIRGHRVEPGEINVVAARYPGIAQCVTHTVAGPGGHAVLVLYYQQQPGCSVEVPFLRKFLSDTLPVYMVPTYLVQVDTIPYTPSGKVDLKAFPNPVAEADGADDSDRYATATELQLASIWKEFFGPGFSRDADFFELGGDSLLAVRLFLQIRKQFKIDLPLSTLTRASSLSGLAACIDGVAEADCSGFRSLQLIHRGDAGCAPLFLIHGGAGNVLIFKALADRLEAKQPVFGFQWSGWDGMRGERSIPDMARFYKKELQECYPPGPVRLGGNCIGGLIAIELADLLRADGYTVMNPLLVWDSPNLESSDYRRTEPWRDPVALTEFEAMKNELIGLAQASAGSQIHAAPAARTSGLIGVLKRIPGLHPFELWIKSLPVRLRIQYGLKSGTPVPVNLRPDYCLMSMIKAVRKYRSHAYDGDLLYIRSYSVMGRDLSLPGWWNDPFLGFRALCRGRFEGYVFGHGHNDILGIPEAADLICEKLYQGDNP